MAGCGIQSLSHPDVDKAREGLYTEIPTGMVAYAGAGYRHIHYGIFLVLADHMADVENRLHY